MLFAGGLARLVIGGSCVTGGGAAWPVVVWLVGAAIVYKKRPSSITKNLECLLEKKLMFR